MTRILTVDDSRAIRNIVSRQVADLGFEVDEAENGLQGLERLSECSYDLVVLDVTMPELDGPGMLAKMREGGDKTPVLMLTSEAKTSIVAGVMKLGISDYILKPFKPEELREKVVKCLGSAAKPGAPRPAGAPSPSPAAAAPAAAARPAAGGGGAGVSLPEGGRQFIDILVVDDMENVHRKLRSLLPSHVSLGGATSGGAAMAVCKENTYRIIVVDTDMPDVDTRGLLGTLKALQPHSAFLGLYLRSSEDPTHKARALGFDGVLLKPFDGEAIDKLVMQYFDKQDVLEHSENVLRAMPFTGKDDRRERYFRNFTTIALGFIPKIAAACYDDVTLDLREMPHDATKAVYVVMNIAERAKKEGLSVRLIAGGETKRVLSSVAETAALPMVDAP